jgi:Transposase zinc-ribbon domain
MAGRGPRAEAEYPRNWLELLAWFPDDAACLRYLERLRWGAGFTCRFWGNCRGRLVADGHPLTAKAPA